MCGPVKMDGVVRPRGTDLYGFVLVRDGETLPRQRQFRKAVWQTRKGAQRAADKLNAPPSASHTDCGNNLTGGQCF